MSVRIVVRAYRLAHGPQSGRNPLYIEGKDTPICPPTAAAGPYILSQRCQLEWRKPIAKALSNYIQCVSQRSMQQV